MNLFYKTAIALFFLVTQIAFSQKEKTIKNADKKFQNFAYIDAREIYLEVAKSGYTSDNLYKKLGDSYYFNNELPGSLEWYEALYKSQKKMDDEYLFRYAMALKSVERYAEADSILTAYRLKQSPEISNSKKTDKSYRDKIDLNLDKFTIKKTNLNSEFSDYAPAYYKSKLVFSSNRKQQDPKQKLHAWNKKPFSDFYMVDIQRDNQVSDKIEPFSKAINSPYHESSAVFTKDGKTMYFTRNNYNKEVYNESDKGVNLIKIYKSTKSGEADWSVPVELPFCNDNYSVAHPALNAKEDKLYFSSDMPGSFGLSDLYVVDINTDGSFSEPKNLGNKINTSGRDTFPFIDQKNNLYFASDGHLGLGGLDVFVLELSDNISNSEIINLGKPINSPKDDFSFIIDNEDNTGYFASNREDKSGMDDIYSFIANDKIVTGCKQKVNGIVTDEISNKGIINVPVTAYDDKLNVISTTLTDANGKYELEINCNVQYVIRVAVNGFQTSEKTLLANNKFNAQNNLNVPLKKGKDLGKNSINYGDDLGKTLLLEPIFFQFDKSTIQQSSEIELQKIIVLMKKFPNLIIEVRSHTDSQGESDYNLNLSKERAKQTVAYFIKKGIAQNRISGDGFGDQYLVNQCDNGISCSDAEHQQNRRSEFILIDKNKISTPIVETVSPSKNEVPPTVVTEKVQTKPLEIQKTPVQNRAVAVQKSYSFAADAPKIFTVQISASKVYDPNQFTNVPNLFHYQYTDGFVRYFSGVFNSHAEATNHKQHLIESGFQGVFVMALQGQNRTKN